jgi:ABC-2 type transport system permease protein
MAGNEAFTMVQERGWQRGLSNLLRGELKSWFGRRRWLTSSLIWVAIVNLILLMVLLQTRQNPSVEDAMNQGNLIFLYTIFGGMFVAVGVVIAMQGAVVGEKVSGTASWILSKPVARQAFILSKAFGNGLGLLFTAVLVPGIIAYLEFSLILYGQPMAVLPFLEGVAILGVNAIFWMLLTLMLGTFFNSWAPVIGIPLALLFGQQFILGMLPQSVYVLPWMLTSTAGDIPSIAGSLILGEAPFSWLPLISTVFLSLLFLGIALWRFRSEEL